MGENFNALTGESKMAVEWKARQNLNMALADGNERALANQQKFLDNNRESLASNEEGLKHVIQEYKQNLASLDD
jgi:hypothetical protein